jgi:hypothetical protein
MSRRSRSLTADCGARPKDYSACERIVQRVVWAADLTQLKDKALRSFALAAWLCCILSVAWYPRQTEYLGGFESEQDAVNWTKFKSQGWAGTQGNAQKPEEGPATSGILDA